MSKSKMNLFLIQAFNIILYLLQKREIYKYLIFDNDNYYFHIYYLVKVYMHILYLYSYILMNYSQCSVSDITLEDEQSKSSEEIIENEYDYSILGFKENPFHQNCLLKINSKHNSGQTMCSSNQNLQKKYISKGNISSSNHDHQQKHQLSNEMLLYNMNYMNSSYLLNNNNNLIHHLNPVYSHKFISNNINYSYNHQNPVSFVSKSINSQNINSQYNQSSSSSSATSKLTSDNYITYMKNTKNHSNDDVDTLKLLKSIDILIIKTQKGSKKLQKLIENNKNPEIIRYIHNLIKPNLYSIINNKFGNYFFQKLIPLLDYSLRSEFWSMVFNNFLTISQNEYGNHVLQTLITYSTGNIHEEEIIFNYINQYFYSLAFDTYGKFIVLKAISIFGDLNKERLIRKVEENLNSLIFNINSVVIVKRYIKIVNSNQDTYDKSLLFSCLKYKYLSISTDKIAHYVLLCIVDEFPHEELNDLFEFLVLNFKSYLENRYITSIIYRILETNNESVSD